MKKIISLTVAIIITFLFLAFPFVVSANDESGMTNQEYYAAQAYLIAKYKDGKISYSEFQEQSQAVTDEFVSKNTVGGVLQSGALNASNTFNAVSQKIGNTVQKYGDSARDYLSSVVSDFFDDYKVLSDKPTVDLHGGTCGAYIYDDDGKLVRKFIGASNGVIIIDNLGRVTYDVKSCIYTWQLKPVESETFHTPEDNYTRHFSVNVDYTLKLFGDWRYEDDTQAPTDDSYETISDYDFTQATEKELEDLIKDLLNEFELQMPDLSSIEGLLNAIYARLGTLDSDNDNELLNSINSAVLALVKSNDDNNEALLDELLNFRNDLKNGTVGSDSSVHGHEISGTLYNVIPLDKNWLNKIFHDKQNLKVQYEGKTYYLEDCGCLKLDDKFYTPNMNYDYYSKFDYDFSSESDDIDHIVKLSDENKSIFDIDFGSINDLIPSKNTRMRKASTFSLNEEKNFLDDIFNHSQVRKIDGAVGLLEDFIAIGVPYESIQENFSVYEEIIFNDYLPRDLCFTIFDTDVVLLRYSDFITDVGNETTSYTEPIAIVRALSSILIGFYWVFSMYKKLSNLI